MNVLSNLGLLSLLIHWICSHIIHQNKVKPKNLGPSWSNKKLINTSYFSKVSWSCSMKRVGGAYENEDCYRLNSYSSFNKDGLLDDKLLTEFDNI